MVILQVFSAFVAWIHTLTAFAYLPELTQDAKLLASWTASFHVNQYIALVLFLVYMLGILRATGFGDDVILASRVASISSLAIATPCYMWTWTSLMKRRDAFRPLPQGSMLATVGFRKVFLTSIVLYTRYRALMWFFVNVALVEAAQQSIAAISLTFMLDTLQLTVTEYGIAILMLFVFGTVGTIIGKVSMAWVDPIRSNQISQIVTIANTAMAAVILTGPGQQMRAYIVASIWGLGAGWKTMVERFMITQVIPKGQDAELMGFYLFSSQVLVWLPTLIFTAMNEAGVSQRVGVSMLIPFFLGGIVSLWMMGPYDDAVRLAREEEEEEVGSSDDGSGNGVEEKIDIDEDGEEDISIHTDL